MDLMHRKQAAAGDSINAYGNDSEGSEAQNMTFLTNLGLPFEYVVQP